MFHWKKIQLNHFLFTIYYLSILQLLLPKIKSWITPRIWILTRRIKSFSDSFSTSISFVIASIEIYKRNIANGKRCRAGREVLMFPGGGIRLHTTRTSCHRKLQVWYLVEVMVIIEENQQSESLLARWRFYSTACDACLSITWFVTRWKYSWVKYLFFFLFLSSYSSILFIANLVISM